ncbi:MAG: hypothetical protein ACT4NX_05765 [Deltaproteobacteria bacterium]
MGKKTITVDIFQCDFIDDKGSCSNEGERPAIKQCAICKKDLCNRHYETFNIQKLSGPTGASGTLIYFFCWDHSQEFINMLVQTLGDTRPIAYAGMAK